MKRPFAILLLSLCLLLLLDSRALPAPLATPDALILVTSVADTTVADGACTLREAILVNVNQRPNNDCPAGTGIGFNVPGTGVKKIVLSAPLPLLDSITHSVTLIDGYTQPGSRPNSLGLGEPGSDARLMIELDASNLPYDTPVLRSTGLGDGAFPFPLTIRGLIINHHTGPAIMGNCNLTINGNFIGTDATGERRVGESTQAIFIERPDEVPSCRLQIGSSSAADRNLLTGFVNLVYTRDNRGNSATTLIENNLIGISLAKQISTTVGGAINLVTPQTTDVLTIRRNQIAGGGIRLSDLSGASRFHLPADLTIIQNIITDSEVGIELDGICPTISRIGSQISDNLISNSDIGISYQILRNDIACPANIGIAMNRNRMVNTIQAINLGNGGVNAPDILDLDSGPNGLQNYPTLTAAQTDGSKIQIDMRLYSRAQGSYTIDLFGNRGCDLTTGLVSAAEVFLMSSTVTTNSVGQTSLVSLSPTLPTGVSLAGLNSVSVMATGKQLATDTQLVSSEVSPCLPLRPYPLQMSSVSPTSIVAGSSSVNLAVRGGTFTANTTATLDGNARSVSVQSATTMAVTLPASDLATRATHTLQLRHPNGTQSNPVTIHVVSPTVGVSQVTPPQAILEPAMATTLVLTWTHPTANWRLLDTLDLKLEDGDGPGIWLRFHEARTATVDESTFSLLNPDGTVAGTGRGGEARVIEGESATLFLAETRFQGSGPDPEDKSVTLTLRFAPKVTVAGRDFMLGVYLKDDNGVSEGPQIVGQWQVVWPTSTYLPVVRQE
ncbi:MAG: CSLREA domain-containing protein [Ardenticatenales bacterium]|nr:CSLREA domain-containing protein [Ardenticatenales bacterium]